MTIEEEKTMSLTNKIDFAVVFTVKNANPNGDPLNGNRPRTNYDGYGEVSDVCLKRKLRNRLQDMGEQIFVQADDKRADGYRSLKDRFDNNELMQAAGGDREKQRELACSIWFDVRAFGQVLAFRSNPAATTENAVSIGIRGPVSIQSAVSLELVTVNSMQITKSVNLETQKDPDRKAPDTMGMKHRIDYGVYVSFGSINCQLAEKTGFSDADADTLHEALKTLFVNDMSSARPDGSMEVNKVVWWKHDCKNGQYSAARVHESLKISGTAKGEILSVESADLPGLIPEIDDGI
jgi:CRISPR-associated protein Csd2